MTTRYFDKNGPALITADAVTPPTNGEAALQSCAMLIQYHQAKHLLHPNFNAIAPTAVESSKLARLEALLQQKSTSTTSTVKTEVNSSSTSTTTPTPATQQQNIEPKSNIIDLTQGVYYGPSAPLNRSAALDRFPTYLDPIVTAE